MKKTHNSKYKHTEGYSEHDEDRNDEGSRREVNERHHRRHKHKDRESDYVHSNFKNISSESPLRSNCDEVIEIHGSSSEGGSENDSGSFDSEKHNSFESHSYKHHKKEERRHKKRRKRSRSGSQPHERDKNVDFVPNKHRKLREERNSRSACVSENQSSNEHRKNKARGHSTNDSMESADKNQRSGENRSRIHVEENIKIKLERRETEVQRELHDGESRFGSRGNTRNNHQEPSGSRNRTRSRGNRDGGGGEGGHTWGGAKSNNSKTGKPHGEVQKPNFELSGKLTEDVNTYNGVVIKYSEPPEARIPKKRWRLYPFKGDEPLPPLYIHRQSAYLLGRDRKVVDMPIDHPSCSKQHAALQYRLVSMERPDGTMRKLIRLYIIDLESANGTFVNNKRIEPRKYVELLEKDVIKFGFSSREYVLLHEHSKDDDLCPDET